MATTDRRGVSVDATDSAIAGGPNPGLGIKAPCRAATTAAITLSGLQTFDGIVLAAGDRVLVKNQTDAKQNGIYNASSGNWTRAIDAAGNGQWANGTVVYVALGTANGDKSFIQTALDPVLVGTSLITFLFLASSGVPASRNVNTSAPLSGGGTLAGDLTLSLTINGSLQVTGGALAVAALAGIAHQWVSSFSASGVPALTQPGFGDLSGNATAAQGGTGRTTLTAHAVLLGEGTGNVAFATIGTSGALLVDQGAGADPAFAAMSGDATLTSAGVLTVGNAKVTYAKVQNVAASRLLGNPTGAPAAPSEISLAATLAFSGTALGANLTTATNSLSGDVALNNTANYFDGPSCAQGSTGTWFVSGTVTLTDTAGGTGSFFCKLWDGTTVIASAATSVFAVANDLYVVTLSGFMTSPAGNLRISCRDTAATSGKILFNATGASKDSTITAVRIA